MIDVERSPVPPGSLAARVDGCWRAKDVRDRLREDFLAKCYLCESPTAAFQVDHRLPKGAPKSPQWEVRAFEWTNLFPACEHCNNGRPKQVSADVLLSPGDGVELRLLQGHGDDGPIFGPLDESDGPAVALARELRHLHLRSHPAAADLRQSIQRRIVHVLEIQLELLTLPGDADPEIATELRERLRAAVSRRAPYTMLVRSKVRPAFSDLFD